MMILIIMLVAVFALILGFSLGYTVEADSKIHKKQITKKQDSAELQKEYENFLNYDGTVQE